MSSIMFKNFLFLLVLSLKLKFYIGEKSLQFFTDEWFLKGKTVKESNSSELCNLWELNSQAGNLHWFYEEKMEIYIEKKEKKKKGSRERNRLRK